MGSGRAGGEGLREEGGEGVRGAGCVEGDRGGVIGGLQGALDEAI